MIRADQRKIQSLEEDLKEVGLDPVKTLNEIHRTTALVENRFGPQAGGGSPSWLQPPAQDPAQDPATQAAGGGEDLDEAFKAIKMKIKTAGMKLKSKLARKKTGLGKLRRASKLYYKKFKRKIAKRTKKKLAKFGRAGLEKLHKMKKRVVMSEPDESPLASLREDLNDIASTDVDDDRRTSPFEEMAFNTSMLALKLGEMFEVYGDEQSAETMYSLSDVSADLSEELDALEEDGELDEDQEERLGRVLEGVIKALRMYEAMGSPSLGQILEFRAENGGDSEEGEGEGGEGEGSGEGDSAAA